MELAITAHRDELIQALGDFVPVRIVLASAEGTDDPRWVQVDALEEVTFLPGSGLRATCSARVHYPLPILPDDFTVKHVSLEVVPAIIAGPNGAVLAFTLRVGELDIKHLPDFVDRAVAKQINDGLRENATSIAWDFEKTLHRTVRLTERLGLVRALLLGVPRGSVEVTADGIVLRLALHVSFEHEAGGGAAVT